MRESHSSTTATNTAALTIATLSARHDDVWFLFVASCNLRSKVEYEGSDKAIEVVPQSPRRPPNVSPLASRYLHYPTPYDVAPTISLL